MSKMIVRRGNVSTVFSVGSRIKSTGSVVVVDFLDVDDSDVNHIVASVALEMDTAENMIEGLQQVLEAIKSDK